LSINGRIAPLPESIGNLSKLEKIRLLRCTELESLPGTIGNLQSLKTFYIRGGKITALPESIGNIIPLLSIMLQYTNIANLPASIGNLRNLVSLGVYGYQNEGQWAGEDNYPDWFQEENTEKRSPFIGLPDTASKLVSLEFLIFNNSEIKSLPDYLGDLPALRTIQIVDCDVKTIPPSIQRLADSKDLYLIRNEDELYEYQWTKNHIRIKPRRR
jgi:leucine-rich repeat protein SHOC2